MRVLYVIFVLCVGALVWVAVAATRHIRRHESKGGRANESGPSAIDQPLAATMPPTMKDTKTAPRS